MEVSERRKPSRLQLLGVSIFVMLLLTGLVARLLATEKDRMEKAEKERLAGSIETGATLFSLHCRTCHGIRGEGIGQLGPALSDEHFFKQRLSEIGWTASLEEYIVSTTEHGRMMGTRPIYAGNGSTAVMPPWHQKYGGALRNDEIADITAYVLNWQDTATGKVSLSVLEIPEVSLQDPATINLGKRVFQNTCSSCHSYKDIQAVSPSGPDLSDIAQSAGTRKEGMAADEYIRESLLIPDGFIVKGFEGSKVSCGVVMTESDLKAVTGFLLQ